MNAQVRASLELRPPGKGAMGPIVGLIPQRGEWLAAYVVLKAGTGNAPTIVDLCRISELPTMQRKKADAWMSAFSRFAEAAAPSNPSNNPAA